MFSRLRLIMFLAIASLFTLAGQAYAYPLVKIKNNTDYTVTGEVEYASAFCSDDDYRVGPGQTWTASSRGACLVTGINGRAHGSSKHGERTDIVTYTSTGTSYSEFQISPNGDRYRIFSAAEHKKFTKTSSSSPGFKFVNKTDWPVAYSLDQVGCLYYDVIPARFNGKDGTRVVDTGAVWFTMHMNIQPDGVSPINEGEDCILPVVEITAAVLLGVAETVITGSPKASGAIAAKVIAKQAVKTAIKISVEEIADQMASQLQNYMSDAGAVTMYGQYAGYEWPFRCDKMPEYHITGGPKVLKDNEGGVYIEEGSELKVTKVNSCGNDMMLASKKSATASTDLPFPTAVDNFLGGNGSSSSGTISNPSSGGQVTFYQHCNYQGKAVTLSAGNYDYNSILSRGIKNDDVSSIKVSGGAKATLYQDSGYRGRAVTVSRNISCLVSDQFNDEMSSVKITAASQPVRPTPVSSSSNGKVTFYEHCNYQGKAVTLSAGNYDYNSILSRGIKNDDVSSVKVSGGAKATLYQDSGYRGRAVTASHNISCLVSDQFNDEMSSVKITSK